MTGTTWDPALYARFASERGRPFHDLVTVIETTDPTDVVDLGCGPGTTTARLCQRWPGARVRGIDSSPEMIARAQQLARPGGLTNAGGLDFAIGSIEHWAPDDDSIDVIIANASLQWVPDHLALLPRWVRALRPGGTLAFQVPPPGSPASRIFHGVATSPRWAAALGPLATGTGPWADRSPVVESAEYLDLLSRLGTAVTAWETTYLHVLGGDDPVLEWFAGTALRPYFEALGGDASAAAEFRAEVAGQLREAFPRREYGTVLPFRRAFVVARRG